MIVDGKEYPGSVREYAQMWYDTGRPGTRFDYIDVARWWLHQLYPAGTSALALYVYSAASEVANRVIRTGRKAGLWKNVGREGARALFERTPQ